jgi:hypothetical protein
LTWWRAAPPRFLSSPSRRQKYLSHWLIKKKIAHLISEKSDKKHHNP